MTSDEPAGADAPEEPHDVGVEVDAVDDRLEDDVGAHERGADDAGVAVREGSHRVEHVRHRADAAVERRVRLGGGGVRVTERDDDAPTVEEVDEVERPGKLRRERHEAYAARAEEPLEERRIGVAASGEAVRPEPRGGEERPLEVDAEDSRPGERVAGRTRSPRTRSASSEVISVGR